MIKKDQILVATRSQYYSCGKTKLHMGAIIKAANFENEDNNTVIVYLSKLRETKNDWERIETDDNKVRLATQEEICMWDAGIRNCKGELI